MIDSQIDKAVVQWREVGARQMAYFSNLFPMRVEWQEIRRYVQLPVTIRIHSERQYLKYEHEIATLRLFAPAYRCNKCGSYNESPNQNFLCTATVPFKDGVFGLCVGNVVPYDPVKATLVCEYSVWEWIKTPFVRYFDAR